MSAPPAHRPTTRALIATFLRQFAVQGSWNFETMLGNGIAFSLDPLIRHLPEDRYKAALARQAQYFNAHPYLAPIAIGALARLELDAHDPAQIGRFRTALCGPLGSLGDQLVWSAWLPLCSLLAIGAFGAGASVLAVACIFLGLYNTGHLALRLWGLRVGLARGMRVASALATPVLRQGPLVIARIAVPVAGVVLPIALARAAGAGRLMAGWGWVMIGTLVGAAGLTWVRGKAQGWQIALGAVAVFVLYSVVR